MINDPLWGKIKCVDAEKLEELLKEIKPGIRCKDCKYLFKKVIKHIKAWNIWRKRSLDGKMYKVLVLFGLCHAPTFEILEKWG